MGLFLEDAAYRSMFASSSASSSCWDIMILDVVLVREVTAVSAVSPAVVVLGNSSLSDGVLLLKYFFQKSICLWGRVKILPRHSSPSPSLFQVTEPVLGLKNYFI